MTRKAFTLIELLVVIAIIAILAAILFPVFAQAKAAAKKAASISNFKQQGLAMIQYQSDYDDAFTIACYNNTVDANPANPDSMPELMMMPYMKNTNIMEDPMDPAGTDERATMEVIDPNSRPGYVAAQRLLNLTYKSDWGLNWQFLFPMPNDSSGRIAPIAVTGSQIHKPAEMILAIDSVWNRDGTGKPYGGGNEALDPPCVLGPPGTGDTRPNAPYNNGYWWYGGWNPGQPLAWNVFGGVWPYHNDKRMCVTSFIDGHTKALNVSAASKGCDVRNGWGGRITDWSSYMWNPKDQ